ncbi:hypothetical protein P3C33_16205 [Mesorhizobium sp. P16.1]|uniref:hypothetical protein n=1 Tax=unclassified Mesorhizobium TaxID=325217 RepID=UPI001FE134AC|nr:MULTISPECIES: hypothetical protein [unclassified Mesorhizobium]MCT2578776.1 hypothetical protein [Mesorhizobium sp. P13.3]MDF3167715.1 hypothetical protein [Mesorhizobium sp. P16.1]MDF3184628.1 hypothetical protein [Mesorhizobium sp. ICCV3110.1]
MAVGANPLFGRTVEALEKYRPVVARLGRVAQVLATFQNHDAPAGAAQAMGQGSASYA